MDLETCVPWRGKSEHGVFLMRWIRHVCRDDFEETLVNVRSRIHAGHALVVESQAYRMTLKATGRASDWRT